eukprot:snap_masked-scaffold_11-processed-gene-7.38-mRNA-1 protein AED:1.00 eAED:1.00 QI:0/0/0/0/1/1/3/0/85
MILSYYLTLTLLVEWLCLKKLDSSEQKFSTAKLCCGVPGNFKKSSCINGIKVIKQYHVYISQITIQFFTRQGGMYMNNPETLSNF